MKKIAFLLMGIAMLAVGCGEKNQEIQPVDGGMVFDYKPETQSVDVVGELIASNSPDWLTISQSGNKVTGTVKLNMTGGIRSAQFFFQNGAKFTVTQKSGTSDAVITPSVKDYDGLTFKLNVNFKSSEAEYYKDWGVAYGKNSDRSDATEKAGEGAVKVGDNEISVTPAVLENLYVWGYVVTTEGDKFYSSTPVPLEPAYNVKAGADLQAIINAAPEFAEIKVAGGAVFEGPFVFEEKDRNKKISGGWNEDFTEQSVDNLTVIDGGGKNRGFICVADAGGGKPMSGSVEISYFEIRNCFHADNGAALLASGHPIIIHHCYVHNNESGRGVIYTADGAGSFSSELIAYSNIIVNNVAHGHAPGIEISDGKGGTDLTQGFIIGNLFANNVSDKFDGYAGAVIIQHKSSAVLLNNTFINNFNYYEDNGNTWETITIRGYSRILFANNIMVCNWASQRGKEGEVWKMPRPSPTGYKTLFNNIAEVVDMNWLIDNRPFGDNVIYDEFIDPKIILSNPDSQYPGTYNQLSDFTGGNYAPVGVAVGMGTLAESVEYWCFDEEEHQFVNLKEMLETYSTCFTGEPFIKDGKVSAGCFPAK